VKVNYRIFHKFATFPLAKRFEQTQTTFDTKPTKEVQTKPKQTKTKQNKINFIKLTNTKKNEAEI